MSKSAFHGDAPGLVYQWSGGTVSPLHPTKRLVATLLVIGTLTSVFFELGRSNVKAAEASFSQGNGASENLASLTFSGRKGSDLAAVAQVANAVDIRVSAG